MKRVGNRSCGLVSSIIELNNGGGIGGEKLSRDGSCSTRWHKGFIRLSGLIPCDRNQDVYYSCGSYMGSIPYIRAPANTSSSAGGMSESTSCFPFAFESLYVFFACQTKSLNREREKLGWFLVCLRKHGKENVNNVFTYGLLFYRHEMTDPNGPVKHTYVFPFNMKAHTLAHTYKQKSEIYAFVRIRKHFSFRVTCFVLRKHKKSVSEAASQVRPRWFDEHERQRVPWLSIS